MTDNTKIEPTWPRGMYGCPQDMYGASVVLPLIAERDSLRRLHEAATERTVQLAAVIAAVQCDDLCASWDQQPCSCWKSGANTDAALREHDGEVAAAIREEAAQIATDYLTTHEWLPEAGDLAALIREGRDA